VVEDAQVADRHGAQEIARLVVAHPVPARHALALEIGQTEDIRFAFYKPVLHSFAP